MDSWLSLLLVAITTLAFGELLRPLSRWPHGTKLLINWLCHPFRVHTEVEELQEAILISVRNDSREEIEVCEGRLMLTRHYGIGMDDEYAPLPVTVAVGEKVTWGCPKEDVLAVIKRVSQHPTTRLTPRILDSKGRAYWGKAGIVVRRDGTIRSVDRLNRSMWAVADAVMIAVLTALTAMTVAVVTVSTGGIR